MKYQVYVGNIGMVYDGDDEVEARSTFNEYVEQSTIGCGRAADEDVTLREDGEILDEHFGV